MRIFVSLLGASLILAILQSIVPGTVLGIRESDMTLGLVAVVVFLVGLGYGVRRGRSSLAGSLAVAGVGCVLLGLLMVGTRVPGSTGPSVNEILLAAGAALLLVSVAATVRSLRTQAVAA